MRAVVTACLAACLLAAAGPRAAPAGTAATVPLTLAEALARAEAANPRLRAAALDARARQRAAQAEAGRRFGELRLDGGLVRNSDATLVRPMTPDLLAAGVPAMPFADNYAFWALDYRVPLVGWGTVSGAREAARLGARAGAATAARTAAEIRHRVLATFLGVLALDEQIAALRQELAALDTLAAHVDLGERIGRYSRIDLLKSRVERENAAARLADLTAARRARYADLMALLGEQDPGATSYSLVPVTPAPADTVPPPVPELVATALARRSDLRAARAAAAARRAAARAARGARLPQLSVGGRLTGVHAGTIDYDDTYWTVDARLSLPLFDMGRRRQQARKAELEARGADLGAVDLADRIRAEVTAAAADVDRARGEIAARRAALDLAREVARLEQLRYDTGRGDMDDLLHALAQRRLAESALIRARYDLLTALDALHLACEGE